MTDFIIDVWKSVSDTLHSTLDPILPCQLYRGTGTLQVLVRDPTKGNAGVLLAFVTITASDGSTLNDYTAGNGLTEVHTMAPGTYSVSALALWYVPDPSPAVQVVVVEGQLTQATIDLEELRFYLHVDADRNGVVDNDRARNYPWNWGANFRGAIVLCNNDDDDASAARDNSDANINGAADVPEIAPLEVRPHGSNQQPPNTWMMKLSVADDTRAHVRLFASRANNAAEIIGPTTGASYERSLDNHGSVTYGVEAVHYAGTGFNGLVDVKLEVRRTVLLPELLRLRAASYSTMVQFRVAPWMMPNHADRAHSVYIVDDSPGPNANANIRNQLTPLLGVAVANCNLVVHQIPDEDYWMQDCMEIGYSNSPAARIDTVLKAVRANTLRTYPATLLGADLGLSDEIATAARARTDSDGMGNLEITPPCRTNAGVEYPWGRIYYGTGTALRPFNANMLAFLKAQVVQKPIGLDAHWLRVGHVDEFMTFVPYAAGAPFKQWKLLLASPRRAYHLLRYCDQNLQMLQNATTHIMTGNGTVHTPMQMTVNNFRTAAQLSPDPDTPNGGPAQWISAAQLQTWNGRVQARIDLVRPILQTAIELEDDDIIEVPVIFLPEDADWNRVGAGTHDIPNSCTGALTGDMVNMLVVNGHCIIPEARGPLTAAGVDLFQRDLDNKLTALGLDTHFIDCWQPYHEHHGEIHCGTNTWRKPANIGTWLGTAPARWWEFDG